MGLKFNFLHKFFKKKKKIFIVGYDCGFDNSEQIELVCAYELNEALRYAEQAAVQLYEDYGMLPSYLEFCNEDDEEFADIEKECLFNAIGFWAREFNKKTDISLIEEYGVREMIDEV
jgi:hypothetical protein